MLQNAPEGLFGALKGPHRASRGPEYRIPVGRVPASGAPGTGPPPLVEQVQLEFSTDFGIPFIYIYIYMDGKKIK